MPHPRDVPHPFAVDWFDIAADAAKAALAEREHGAEIRLEFEFMADYAKFAVGGEWGLGANKRRAAFAAPCSRFTDPETARALGRKMALAVAGKILN